MRTRHAILLLLGCWAGLAVAATVDVRAARIRIRSLDLEDTSPRAAFEFLRQKAKEADPDGIGLNMIFRITPQARKAFNEGSITLQLTDVPLTAAVRYLCLVSGLQYTYDENALLVFDAGSAAPAAPAMQTRTYPIAPGLVDSPRTRARASSIERDDTSNNGDSNH
jgi:hypothetical protein